MDLMTEKEEKLCPNCKIVSIGKVSIEKYHGYRNVAGKIKPQSLCRNCRRIHAQKARDIRKKYPKLDNVDLRTIGDSKSWKTVMSSPTIKKADIPKASKEIVGKKLDIGKLKKNGNPKTVKWLSLSKQQKTEWSQSKKDNRSIWDKLTKVQQDKFNAGHAKYVLQVEQKEKNSIKVTKKKHQNKRKQMRIFQKEQIAFSTATNQGTKRGKKN